MKHLLAVFIVFAMFSMANADNTEITNISEDIDDITSNNIDISSGTASISVDPTDALSSNTYFYVVDGSSEWSEISITNPSIAIEADILDLSSVKEIQLSKELKTQLRQEVEQMGIHVSLSWGTWFMIFALSVIAAKIAHRITLKTVFRPTKWAALKAEKAAKETAETVKREWEES